MKNKFINYGLAIILLALFVSINFISSIYPDELAFVFCSVVFTQYVDLVIYIHNLSEQFHPVWWHWQH